MAVYDGIGDDGQELWMDWAASRSEPDAAEDAATWKSAKRPGKVRVGTLFGRAKDHGFTFETPDKSAPAPDAEALAKAQAERERKRAAAEAEYRRRADDAARVARDLWTGAESDQAAVSEHAYLKAKGVGAHGVRIQGDLLLVPMRDEDGKLQNVQRISATEKRYLPGGRKTGMHHMLAASCSGLPDVILIAEGYATAASCCEAMGLLTTVVAFDAGNLRPVAESIHAQYPAALIVICADNDWETAAAKGENPGVAKAKAAARAVTRAGGRCRVVWPMSVEGVAGESDFNDIAKRLGLGVVAEGIQAAIDDASDVQDPVEDDLGDDSPAPPSADAIASPAAPEEGGGRPEKKKIRPPEFWDRVNDLIGNFYLIYGSDTAWDDSKQLIIKVQSMRLAFGREPVNFWLDSPRRRMIMPSDLVFEPGRDVTGDQINMFRGLPIKPVASTAADVAPMLDLLRHLCSESDVSADDADAVMHWVLCWQALPLQKIGTKMQTAVVMHGAQGTGKNLYWDAWRDLFGDAGITVGQTELEDKFNGWLSRKLAIIGDEVVSRQEMYHNKNRLKLIVTQMDRFPIRGMMQETRWESNHANVVFLSNENQPLSLEERDRRYLVVYTPLEADVSLYRRVRDFLSSAGGPAKWLHYLQSYPLDDFGAHTKPMMTQAKKDLVELGWRPSQRFAAEWLEGFLALPRRVCSNEQLYRAFKAWADRNGERWPPSQAVFTSEVRRFVHERRGVDAAGQRAAAALVYKPIGLKSLSSSDYKTVRCWVPGGVSAPHGVPEGEWAMHGVEAFEADLSRYLRRGQPLEDNE
jgi:putative DNA primase/helicase